MPVEKQSLAQIVSRVRIGGIKFSGPLQVGKRFFHFTGFEQAMSELVEKLGIVGRADQFLPVFGDGFLVASQAGIGESQVIVPERRVGIDPQRALKLLDRLHGAVRVLVCASQQDVGQRMGGLQLDGFFQFVRCGSSIDSAEADQRQIEVNVEMAALEGFGTLERLQRRRVLPRFEVGESEPMLELGVPRPTGDGFLSDLHGFRQPSQLEISSAPVRGWLEDFRGNLPGAFETGGGARIVVSIERRLAASEQLLNARRLRPARRCWPGRPGRPRGAGIWPA